MTTIDPKQFYSLAYFREVGAVADLLVGRGAADKAELKALSLEEGCGTTEFLITKDGNSFDLFLFWPNASIIMWGSKLGVTAEQAEAIASVLMEALPFTTSNRTNTESPDPETGFKSLYVIRGDHVIPPKGSPFYNTAMKEQDFLS